MFPLHEKSYKGTAKTGIMQGINPKKMCTLRQKVHFLTQSTLKTCYSLVSLLFPFCFLSVSLLSPFDVL